MCEDIIRFVKIYPLLHSSLNILLLIRFNINVVLDVGK